MSGFFDLFKRKPPYGADKDTVGRYGEKICRKYLRQHGYSIVARNYRGSRGEIDVIAESGDCFVFVEVKTRKYFPGSPFGDPRDAVNREKQLHIIRTAKEFLWEHPTAKSVRFDIFEVLIHHDHTETNHIKGAFHP